MACKLVAPNQTLSISHRRSTDIEDSGKASWVLQKESGSRGRSERKLCHWGKDALGSYDPRSPKTVASGGRERCKYRTLSWSVWDCSVSSRLG